MSEQSTIRLHKETIKRFRKHNPYKDKGATVTDDWLLNYILDQLEKEV